MKRSLLFFIDIYKRWISPALPRSCRYTPTCSRYASEAIDHHGALKGVTLGALRVLRCHPLGGSGYDPVPPGNGAGASK